MAKKVRIGVLGAGRIGKLHIMNLCQAVPGAEVVAVADPFLNDETAEWCKSLGIEITSKDPEVSSSRLLRLASTSSAKSRSIPTWQRFMRPWTLLRRPA